ncbi:MAG: hypothetical protein ACOXZH_09505 [Bacteroidales bacterium]|nr:hypothetical protein [Bacteroidales bacterium]
MLLLVVVLGMIGVSCRKIAMKKWEGVYECEKSYNTSCWNPTTGETYSYDTSHKAIVDVVAIDDSILHIEERDLGRYSHGVRHNVIVNTNGNFTRLIEGNSGSTPYINGYFNKNGINIEYETRSQIATIHISYNGKKL